MIPAVGVKPPPARVVTGGMTADIPPATPDASGVPGGVIGRPAMGNDDASQGDGWNGATGHGEDTDPIKGSFM
jgi:hypothetical protein